MVKFSVCDIQNPEGLIKVTLCSVRRHNKYNLSLESTMLVVHQGSIATGKWMSLSICKCQVSSKGLYDSKVVVPGKNVFGNCYDMVICIMYIYY